jgi:hypothetical protein
MIIIVLILNSPENIIIITILSKIMIDKKEDRKVFILKNFLGLFFIIFFAGRLYGDWRKLLVTVTFDFVIDP